MFSYVELYELLLYERKFGPFSRIWEIWSMDEIVHFILRVVVPGEDTWPMERIMIFHGVEFGPNKLEFCFDMKATPRVWRNVVILDLKGV